MLVESLIGANATLVKGCAANCNQPGFSCSGKTGVASLMASIFAINVGASEVVFQFASPINVFPLKLPNGPAMGLSNVRAFNASVVPIPAALPLLLTGIAGAVGTNRRGRRKSKKA